MKYHITKRRYLDSIFLLLTGTAFLIIISLFIKQPLSKKIVIPKPKVSISTSNKFLYIANTNQSSIVTSYDIPFEQSTLLATNSALRIQNASLLHNHLLYLSGDKNLGINIDTKKLFQNPGDFISPDGKKFISINDDTSILNFSLSYGGKNDTVMPTSFRKSQLHDILGWSPDSNNFYYTTTYSITKQASKSATDTWMQKVGSEMKQMSRVRTWIESSTTSAEMLFKINAQTKNIDNITASIPAPVQQVFYNNVKNEFYIISANTVFQADANNLQTLTHLAIPLQGATAMIYASDNTDRVLHTNGTSLALADIQKRTDKGLFYASNSAVVIPLALNGNTVIFSLQEKDHFSGEILDSARMIRTEFINMQNPLTSTSAAQPIVFASWLKGISVNF